LKHIFFTVTNDLTYDQRMQRICKSLSNAGYKVTLIGRRLKQSLPLRDETYRQKRIYCHFRKGPLFYVEYNMRLFLYLFTQKMDCICAIDLDTILPCYYISRIKKTKRVYDAHELFCEMKEVVTRPRIFKIWKSIERTYVPRFKHGYTVNGHIRNIFRNEYHVEYAIIRNVPLLLDTFQEVKKENFILYQGAINEGRSFETLIPAFTQIRYPLYLYGTGNFMNKAKHLIRTYGLEEKVLLKGVVEPTGLKRITRQAILGITIFENNGLSNYFSLANRFFDYIHAGIPQICVNYPAYQEINNEFKVAILVDDLSAESLAKNINDLIDDPALQAELNENCYRARTKYNWQREEEVLIGFYKKLFD
jgi:glycosyltransferase involved in cell wall biosynthesis